MRMQKDEQERTADLVKEHSKQMLELLAAEQAKIRRELEQELVSRVMTSLTESTCDRAVCSYDDMGL